MKKTFDLVLVVALMFTFLSSCSVTENSSPTSEISKNDSAIEITLENYEQYLKIWAMAFEGSANFNVPPSVVCSVEPQTSNYDYNNVKIIMRVKGEYILHKHIFMGYSSPGVPNYDSTIFHSTGSYDETFNLRLNIGGKLINTEDSKFNINIPTETTINTGNISCEYEIVSVEGTVFKS